MPRVLFVIAPNNFQDNEFLIPAEILRDAGMEIVIASSRAGECRGSLGGEVLASLSLRDVVVTDYVAVIFVGGVGSHVFREDSHAHRICREVIAMNKVLAAICAAPSIPARAGVLAGRRATAFPAEEYYSILREGDAILTKQAVEVDDRIVTADGPASAKKFGEEILRLLNTEREK